MIPWGPGHPVSMHRCPTSPVPGLEAVSVTVEPFVFWGGEDGIRLQFKDALDGDHARSLFVNKYKQTLCSFWSLQSNGRQRKCHCT